MLTSEEKSLLEESLTAILNCPNQISKDSFITTYNAVFLHCNAPSQEYFIRGSDIYEFISQKIDRHTANIEFQGSLELLSEQFNSFKQSINLLTKNFRYIERFYIRSSLLTDSSNILQLKDCFFAKLYYNYIYNIEDSIMDLIFLEIETYRKLYRQECETLKNVVIFYLELLSNIGYENAIKKFHQRYLDDFKNNTNLKIEIGRLLKKIYFEMFFVTNALKEKDICKEIINTLLFRKSEIVDYALKKIKNYEKFKHIYKIISMMPEHVRNKFKSKYEENMIYNLKNCKSFYDLYTVYEKIRDQIDTNKIIGYEEALRNVLKKTFFEFNSERKANMELEMIKVIDWYIKNDRTYLENLAGYDDFNTRVTQRIIEDSDNCDCMNIRPIIYFDIFETVYNDTLIDLYTLYGQYRLLKGHSPLIEQIYTEMIIQTIGWSEVTKLKSSVSSFMNKYNLVIRNSNLANNNLNLSREGHFSLGINKITRPFWDIQKSSINLHSLLESARSAVSELVILENKETLNFNYELSPVIFELNGVMYRMASNVFSTYLYILEHTHLGGISKEVLEERVMDPKINKNIDILLESNIIENNGLFIATNRMADNLKSHVDLFEVEKKIFMKNEEQIILEKLSHILEANICRLLKKVKKIHKRELANLLKYSIEEVESTINSLSDKGYLEQFQEIIYYIP